MDPQRILVVDDDPQVLTYLARSLERAGYSVESTASSVQAMALIDRQKFDLLAADLSMPELDGFDFSEKRMSA
jgi:two-component system cell cycle response regulator CpdR